MDAIATQADGSPLRSGVKTASCKAILAAARRVAEREGVVDMSLAAVAREAGFAPTAVYAYYSSKNELLLAVVADDLATLARAMRGTFGVSDSDDAGPAGGEPPPEAASSVSVLPAPAPAAPSPPAANAGEATGAAAPNTAAIPQPATAQNAPSAADALARLQETVAKLETRPVDAWLERRLREFERALSALEGRRGQQGTSQHSVEERLAEVGSTVGELEQRLLAQSAESANRFSRSLDECENRLRRLFSESQGESVALDRRLTAVENAAFAANPEFFAGSRAAPQTLDPAGQSPEAAPTEPASAATLAPPAATSASYLAAARKSARVAAAVEIPRARKKSKRRSETMLYLTMGSFFLFVALLTAAGLLLRNQALDSPGAPARAQAPLSAPATHVPPHSAKADAKARLLTLAAAGNATAELVVGLSFLEGDRSAAREHAAFEWLSRAAAGKQALAEYQVGLMYQNGRGVTSDAALAFHWFESAALQGNRKAMHSLATSYVEGWGTEKNMTAAARWFDRAATLGSVNDQFNLGVLYERGMGVPQSLTDAYRWYAIAAAQGDRESAARIAALASTLPADDLAAARSAAESFKPQPLQAAANLPPSLPKS